jgi:microcystin-dependent protein
MSNGAGIGPTTGPPVLSGEGSPEGLVTAQTGAMYRRTDGGDGTTLYVKQSGDNTDTGWVPIPPATSFVPVGTLLDYAGPTAPAGFLLCFGQSVSTTTYAGLFAVIGYAWGGSGANFTIPDLRGYVVCGIGNMGGTESSRINSYVGSALAATGGKQNHVLDGNELTYHNHTAPDHLHSMQNHQHYTLCAVMNYTGTARGGSGTFSIDNVNQWGSGPNYGTTGACDRSMATDYRGGNWAHINVQPTRAVNKIIKI